MKLRSDRGDATIFTIVAVLVVAIVVIGFFAIREHNQWERWCRSQGGRVDSDTKTHYVTTWHNGTAGSGSSTSTTYYCLNSSGGIIDIK